MFAFATFFSGQFGLDVNVTFSW